MPAYSPAPDRLMQSIVVNPSTCCWLFTGSLDACGYGKMNGGKDFPNETLAHRVSYMAFVGLIPRGTEIDHQCNKRDCINPAHLRAITHAENVARGDYQTNHRNRIKTHCKRGHEFTPQNTMANRWGDKTTRKCRTCDNARQARKGRPQ